MANTQKTIERGKTALGIELGSTRINAVLIGEDHKPIASSFSTCSQSAPIAQAPKLTVDTFHLVQPNSLYFILATPVSYIYLLLNFNDFKVTKAFFRTKYKLSKAMMSENLLTRIRKFDIMYRDRSRYRSRYSLLYQSIQLPYS